MTSAPAWYFGAQSLPPCLSTMCSPTEAPLKDSLTVTQAVCAAMEGTEGSVRSTTPTNTNSEPAHASRAEGQPAQTHPKAWELSNDSRNSVRMAYSDLLTVYNGASQHQYHEPQVRFWEALPERYR